MSSASGAGAAAAAGASPEAGEGGEVEAAGGARLPPRKPPSLDSLDTVEAASEDTLLRVKKQLKAQRKLIAKQADQISNLTSELVQREGIGLAAGTAAPAAASDSPLGCRSATAQESPPLFHAWQREGAVGGSSGGARGAPRTVELAHVSTLPQEETPQRRRRRKGSSNAASSIQSAVSSTPSLRLAV